MDSGKSSILRSNFDCRQLSIMIKDSRCWHSFRAAEPYFTWLVNRGISKMPLLRILKNMGRLLLLCFIVGGYALPQKEDVVSSVLYFWNHIIDQKKISIPIICEILFKLQGLGKHVKKPFLWKYLSGYRPQNKKSAVVIGTYWMNWYLMEHMKN